MFERRLGMVIDERLDISEKLKILSAAAKYDVACTSSGVERNGNGNTMGNAVACGICHSFASDGRCISLLKILMSNECIYDCKYCINRSSNDIVRATFTPDEICNLTYEFYRRNYIEGLFLSSGIIQNPDYTMKLMYEAVFKLRKVYGFNGYIHVKAIPGADKEIIEMMGYLADRMSVNLELPTGDGLRKLAPHKNRKNILTPMRQIQTNINIRQNILGNNGYNNRISTYDMHYIKGNSKNHNMVLAEKSTDIQDIKRDGRYFSPGGQSTQMIVGATKETDYEIITIAENLYNKFQLKRVFYSGYVPINTDINLPAPGTPVPLLREHRLYQADWLLRFYGFKAGELLTPERQQFNMEIDPKCDWAVNHMEKFPMEINNADYYDLLRIPGIGVKSAMRIVMARRYGNLDFSDLKKIGVVLKRAVYFITCKGKMMYNIPVNGEYITRQLMYGDTDHKKFDRCHYRQMELKLE